MVDGDEVFVHAELALERWWYEMAGLPDLLSSAALTTAHRQRDVKRYHFGLDLAASYLRVLIDADQGSNVPDEPSALPRRVSGSSPAV